jgi:hypothetical protein
MAPDLPQLEASIRNAAWQVRHYADQRTESRRLRRAQAILQLGMIVRHAFSVSDDFESLITAVVEGLCPRDDRPPF